MAKNTIQFQPGISLQEFTAKYGTEEQSYLALFEWRWPQVFICPECGHDRYYSLKSMKLVQCN